MIIDFSYYEETYQGGAEEEQFTPAARKAEAVMDNLTFHHIIRQDGNVGQMINGVFTELTEDELDALKMGLCALTDSVINVDKARNQSGNVKSVSSGGESITYGDTAYSDAVKDHSIELNLYRNTLLLYAPPDVFTVNPYYAGVR
jgi:hypothetical protein